MFLSKRIVGDFAYKQKEAAVNQAWKKELNATLRLFFYPCGDFLSLCKCALSLHLAKISW